MIKHLKVPENKAQEVKVFLEKANALHDSFKPISEDGFIFWPLNYEVDGNIVLREPVKVTRVSRDYRKLLPDKIRSLAPRAFDIFGDIAIIKLSEELLLYKSQIATALLSSHKNIKKVALDLGVSGQFRVRNLEMLSGDDSFISTHRENGFDFTLDVSKVYFSPRLATERKRLFDLAKPGEKVLDAFAGSSPFSVVLASKDCQVTSVDSNPEAKSWSYSNFKNNQISEENYTIISEKIEETIDSLENFDRIIMNHPTDSLSYLELLSKKLNPGGFIHLYVILDKLEKIDFKAYLGFGFKCVFERNVHAYSPQSSLKVYDISKTDVNVQKTNQ